MPTLSSSLIQNAQEILKHALKEDAASQDITSQVFIATNQKGHAILITKQAGYWCGDSLIAAAQKLYAKTISIKSKVKDGQSIKTGQTLLTITGNLRAILGLERSLLNLLQHLCGISTLTHQFVSRSEKTKVLDTRKTLPGLRLLQRYAVSVGGGVNHRFNLNSAFLVKENHLAGLSENLHNLITRARKLKKPIIIEAENLNQVREFLSLQVDRILLDNFTPTQLKKAVDLRKQLKSKTPFEVSGGITLKNIKKYTLAGIEYVSVGALTHSALPLDLSLRIKSL